MEYKKKRHKIYLTDFFSKKNKRVNRYSTTIGGREIERGVRESISSALVRNVTVILERLKIKIK